MLVSSGNKTGVDLLFITAGKSFIYIRKSKGPITQPCGLVDRIYNEPYLY
jgi:hypothetical protein